VLLRDGLPSSFLTEVIARIKRMVQDNTRLFESSASSNCSHYEEVPSGQAPSEEQQVLSELEERTPIAQVVNIEQGCPEKRCRGRKRRLGPNAEPLRPTEIVRGSIRQRTFKAEANLSNGPSIKLEEPRPTRTACRRTPSSSSRTRSGRLHKDLKDKAEAREGRLSKKREKEVSKIKEEFYYSDNDEEPRRRSEAEGGDEVDEEIRQCMRQQALDFSLSSDS
jgi:hypothetical protein